MPAMRQLGYAPCNSACSASEPQDSGAKPEPGARAGCHGCLNDFIVDSGCYGEGLARDQSETPGSRLLL
jgi:hypothetical protein